MYRARREAREGAADALMGYVLAKLEL